MPCLTRRSVLGMAFAYAAPSMPPGVSAIIARTLRTDPASHNTDWFGSLLMKGMAEWGRSHVPEASRFARRWLASHIGRPEVSRYSGARGRVVRAGGVPITTYIGQFSLAFPCYEIFRQFRDESARRVCIDIGDIILHRTARNRFGMVAHDDVSEFAIPDTCYFAVDPLMIAAELDRRHGEVYREHAVIQLRGYIDVFLNRETGLAKTILLKDGVGKSYWTRASGWLLWSITGVLRRLPPTDPRFAGFVADLRVLADGVARVQDASGGLRVFLNDPQSPLETTGTAMYAMGVHESVRKGWLPQSYMATAGRAWNYVAQHVSADGKIRGAYTPWAVPAEKGVIEFDRVEMGWIPGFILSAAFEMTVG